jgi:hypothetical protein
MKSDQEIIYEAVRDAWYKRLREIDIAKVLREALQSNLPSHDMIRNDIYHAFAQTTMEILNDTYHSGPHKPQT